ncbi:sugar phosphate isomerase/epimerase [Saonia flava]|uniref:Sugar phosphate isomerase/epimerase n=1 Tax=Saonia flava TaxID=523696 RepID=A0A846R2P0_9FLAO|nr:TIM barrel protein [Saonia flava]NJB71089.1 sugar phosphate isomerase/epimerase [Saonia flava]
MKDNKKNITRRKFIGKSALFTAGTVLASQSVIGAPSILKFYNKPNSFINGVQIGAITYSFRSMEDQSAEAVLKYIKDCGISAIELMGDPAEVFAGKPESTIDRRAFYGLMRAKRDGNLSADQEKEMEDMQAQIDSYNKVVAKWRSEVSMDKFKEFKKMYKEAGVSIYAFKPAAFGKGNTDAEIDFGMRAAKTLGANHVTLEHPSDDAHTLKLGKMASKHNIYVGYHGHEQQTPTFWDTALDQSKHNALNLDIGHYVAAGNSAPLEIIQNKHDRIKSMHIKDRQNKVNGRKNLAWGEGDTPISGALQLMRSNKYQFPATIEMEYEVPEGSDAVKEVAKCLEYCRKALS